VKASGIYWRQELPGGGRAWVARLSRGAESAVLCAPRKAKVLALVSVCLGALGWRLAGTMERVLTEKEMRRTLK
jgi:hypothetical protein